MSQLEPPTDPTRVVLCDLDGVVWLAHEPIGGSVAAVADLRRSGWRVVFVTNASFQTRADVVSSLERVGIEADGDVATSAMAAARLVAPGERVLVCGGQGLFEEARDRGAEAVYAHDWRPSAGKVDAVLVGLYRAMTYDALAVAARAILAGARFVASNTDPVYPTPHGPVPGGGSVVAALSVATGVEPRVAGKPHAPMADLVSEMCGALSGDSCWMIGDRHDTDGAFASRLGVRFAHVATGTIADSPGADLSARDLADVSRRIIGGGL